MTNQETIANLNMISVAFVEPVTKEQRKLIDDTFDNAIKALEQEPCEDAISRQATLAEFKRLYYDDKTVTRCAELVINGMPPVNPQPKTGHWKAKSFHELFCDNCGFDFDIMRNDFIEQMNYCPNCGCHMVEPQESEDKE